jgi:hypothetical protein
MDEALRHGGAARTRWWASPDWRAYEATCGLRPEAGRLAVLADASWRTRVVDLRPDEATLWRGLRRSYRALIQDAESAWHLDICEAAAIDDFREMHTRVAGRTTRPLESWRLMRHWVKTGALVLVGARQRQVLRHVGFAGFERDGAWAYYGHAATEVDDVGAALIWTAMKYLKAVGVTRLELGWQGEATTTKGRGIEFFRRGFGGVDVPADEGDRAWQ